MKKIFNRSLQLAMPIILSYLFMSIGYGLMMNQAGVPWYYSVLASLIVYTGAFQYVMIPLISASAPVFTVAITALFVNSRMFFYGPTFVNRFSKAGWKYPYLVHSLTDETYAVDVSLEESDEDNKTDKMFIVAILSQSGWLLGTLIGATLGNIIPMSMDGVDFCMTAMFITIVIDQWESHKNHFPTIMSAVIAIILLFVLGGNNFMLPSLIICSLIMTMKVRGGQNG